MTTNTCTGLVTDQSIIYYNKAQEPKDGNRHCCFVKKSHQSLHASLLRLKQACNLVLCWCTMAGIA